MPRLAGVPPLLAGRRAPGGRRRRRSAGGSRPPPRAGSDRRAAQAAPTSGRPTGPCPRRPSGWCSGPNRTTRCSSARSASWPRNPSTPRPGVRSPGTAWRRLARDDLEGYRDMPGDRDWWRLAYTPDGTLAGLAVPSRNGQNFVGRLPRRWSRPCAAGGTWTSCWPRPPASLLAAGARQITADTDLPNRPMAAAFDRAGYRNFASRTVLSAPRRQLNGPPHPHPAGPALLWRPLMPIPHASPHPGPTAADPAGDGFVHRCVLTGTEAEQALGLAHQCLRSTAGWTIPVSSRRSACWPTACPGGRGSPCTRPARTATGRPR